MLYTPQAFEFKNKPLNLNIKPQAIKFKIKYLQFEKSTLIIFTFVKLTDLHIAIYVDIPTF